MVNWLSVVGTALAGFLLGWIWYGPLFGKQWMKLMKISKKDMQKAKKKSMVTPMVGGFLATVVMAYVLDTFVRLVAATTFVEGAILGFWLWLGFVATVLLGKVLWGNKSFSLSLIDSLHYLAVLGLMGGLLAVWI